MCEPHSQLFIGMFLLLDCALIACSAPPLLAASSICGLAMLSLSLPTNLGTLLK